jgi:hypothetical protein
VVLESDGSRLWITRWAKRSTDVWPLESEPGGVSSPPTDVQDALMVGAGA